jgi:2-iminobutanoate/2-iminopropanoate deaminase
MDELMAVMGKYFGDWTPASTTVCVNQLSTPGARVELDMIAAYPK